MGKLRVGITGRNGFIGDHLYRYLGLKTEIVLIDFKRSYFDDEGDLVQFVQSCDVVMHLAALNRHEDSQVIYETNLGLVQKLIRAAEKGNARPHIIFSSSTQEADDNQYGRSKREGRNAFERWATNNSCRLTSMVIPNVYGPFCKPFYNSVVATFCHQLAHGLEPQIHSDREIGIIYVMDLVEEMYSLVVSSQETPLQQKTISRYVVKERTRITVSELLRKLKVIKDVYVDQASFPDLQHNFERSLFNTFRCYLPPDFFPRPLKLNTDARGSFVEIARTGSSGQTSYSTTLPGITRGNHYHTRKAERFAVVQGRAKIQLRRIGTNDVIDYYLDGSEPAFVDMPVWYTHNIKNIGEEELLTIFWINEPFNPADPDTFFEAVDLNDEKT